MSKESKKLAEAFTVKAEVEGFLANLEKLKADGTITEEQYILTSEEYYARLGEAASEIARIKNELKKQLEANQRDIETYRSELGNLEVKHKVGELPLDKYQSSDRKLRAKLDELEQYTGELTRLIQASSAADIGVTAKKPRAAIPELLPPTKAATPEKGIEAAKELPVTQGKIGGAWWLLPMFLTWVGGLTAWAINKNKDPKRARSMLFWGIGFTFIWLAVLSLIGLIQNLIILLPSLL